MQTTSSIGSFTVSSPSYPFSQHSHLLYFGGTLSPQTFWNVTHGRLGETQWNTCKVTLPYTLHLMHQLRRTTLKSLWSSVHIEWFPGLATAFVTPEVSLKQPSCHIYFLKITSWLWWLGGRAELVCFLLPTSSLLCLCVPELLIRLHLNTHSTVCSDKDHHSCAALKLCLWAEAPQNLIDEQREQEKGWQAAVQPFPDILTCPQPESSDITRLPWPGSYT